MSGRRPSSLLAAAVAVAVTACGIPRWPVDAPLSSPFGIRFRGVRPELHRGVDLAVPTGTEVRSMAAGRVRFAGNMSGYGNVVWIDHGGDVMTVYAHLSVLRVRAGEAVGGRAVIGLSGATGNATSPHLHFEVWRWGHQRDPVPLLGGFPGGP